jgi:Flp pilus assembly pilin Flp
MLASLLEASLGWAKFGDWLKKSLLNYGLLVLFLAKKINEGVKTIGDGLRNFFRVVNLISIEFTKAFGIDKFAKDLQKNIDTVSGIFDKAKVVFQEAWDSLVSNPIDSFKKKWEEFTTGITESATGVGAGVALIGVGANTFMVGIAVSIYNWLVSVRDWFAEKFTEIATNVETWKTDTVAKFEAWKTDVYATVSLWASDTYRRFTTWKNDVLKTIESWKTSAIEKFNTAKKTIVETISTLVTEFIAKITSLKTDAGVIIEDIKTFFTTFSDYLSIDFQGGMQTVVDNISGMFTGWKDSLIESFQAVMTKIGELLGLWEQITGLEAPSMPSMPNSTTNNNEGTFGGNTNGTAGGEKPKPRSEGRSSTVQVVYNINTSGNNVSWRNDVEIAKAFNQKV